MGGWRLSACVLTILLGVPSMVARAQDEDAGPRLAIDRLGARSGMPLAVNSEAFAARDPIPGAYTAEGGNIAPPIFWSPGPRGTRSFVVIAEDEDARGGPHRILWLVYDIPSEQTALGAGARLRVSRQRNGPVIARGKNSLGTVGYAGPRPTLAEGTHTYHFQVFALDTVLRAPDGASLPFVIGAMRGHVLAAGEIVGTFTASRPVRVASDTAANSTAKKPPPADEDLPEAPAKPEAIPEAPLKPEVKGAEAAPAPTPPAPMQSVASAPTPLQPPAPEKPMQIATAPVPSQPPPATAQEKPVQTLAAQPPSPTPAQKEPAQTFAAQPAAQAQAAPEPVRSAPTQPAPPSATRPGPQPATTAARASEPENPLGPLLSLFATGPSGPQPMPVAVWVSAYSAQAPKGPPPGSNVAPAPATPTPRSAPPEIARVAEARPVEAAPAKAQPAKPPEPDFVPSVFPPIELQPLATDAWRVASERIGLPAMPELPAIREEPLKEPKVTIATAPTPTIAPPPATAPAPQPTVPAPAKPSAQKAEPAQVAAPATAVPASKPTLAPAAADLDFLKETRPPAATEPLPRPERILVADLSFIRLPELPPVEALPPPPDDVLVPVPTGTRSQPPAALTQPKAKSSEATPAPEPAAESENEAPAPAKVAKPSTPKPVSAQAPSSEAPAKPVGLAPASAPPQAIAKPRPSGIPSLRPSSGSKPDGAGG